MRFHPLPGNSFLKLMPTKQLTETGNCSFHPLPGNSFLKHIRGCTRHDVRLGFRPLPGNSFLKPTCKRLMKYNDSSFHPLPGNSFLKHVGLCSAGRSGMTVSIPFRGIHFLNISASGHYGHAWRVSIPFRGIHFLNTLDHSGQPRFFSGFHPLPGNSFLKQEWQAARDAAAARVSIPFRGIHFLNRSHQS